MYFIKHIRMGLARGEKTHLWLAWRDTKLKRSQNCSPTRTIYFRRYTAWSGHNIIGTKGTDYKSLPDQL
ncbi:hypothetical protein EYF80_027118 [Liparis tanakae]|uniref:Uncharacterized protein n=1 Tax=Liparis tanakae TaxID=230148 RepID=A0A4Z2H9W1_9TELE|nr:hypothetical protein EYF80_027118 [Liparis tanakae]